MDYSWPDTGIYACPCGTYYAVKYWRWVDVVARPDLVPGVERDGPYEGRCPDCGALPRALGWWLRVDPAAELAVLHIGSNDRGRVPSILSEHLSFLQQRAFAVAGWMMQPRIEVVRLPEERGHRPTKALSTGFASSGELVIEHVQPASYSPSPPRGEARRPEAEGAGVPQIIGADRQSGPRPAAPPTMGELEGELQLDVAEVIATVKVDKGSKWDVAALTARPVLIREFGYPLLGVRIIGAYMGQTGCIDALIDPAESSATEVFHALSGMFSVRLDLVRPDGSIERRDVDGRGLEVNAAMCLESARGLLRVDGGSFADAQAQLGQRPVGQRLQPGDIRLDPGAFSHVLDAVEADRGLRQLDVLSRKDHLTRLLEVEGVPMAEYDGFRRRILTAATEFGLIAPRRFWRRVVALGLVEDLGEYAERLAARREACEAEEYDLAPDRARSAWTGIWELCRRKSIPPPDPLRRAIERLSLDREELDMDPAGAGGTVVAPPPEPTVGRGDRASPLAKRLADPATRLKVVTEILQGRTAGELEQVFSVIDHFSEDELLAVMPDLADLGTTAVRFLVAKLGGPVPRLRQAAAILLGLAQDPSTLEALASRLVREDEPLWVDVARSLGNFGPVALRRLCQTLRRDSGTSHEQRSLERVARALAEIALSDGDAGFSQPSPAFDAVAALADAADPRVGEAARRALATLAEVQQSGNIARGETIQSDHSPSPSEQFARLAYEAITIPELEAEEA